MMSDDGLKIRFRPIRDKIHDTLYYYFFLVELGPA